MATLVHQTTRKLLKAGLVKNEPLWLKVLERTPPPSIAAVYVNRFPGSECKQKWLPDEIVFPEDELRRQFYRDHPVELATPRVLVERDGVNCRFASLQEAFMKEGNVHGEHVVQYQLQLMEEGKTKEEAYAVAVKEFRKIRERQEIEARVALEEAKKMGAIKERKWSEKFFAVEEEFLQKSKELL